MQRLFAEVRPSADVEYLASALIRDAVRNKFRDLFGRDPVERSAESPMRVDNGRVPDLVLESVDANVAKLLKASAIEASDNASGDVPDINNCTLLYTVLDDAQAHIALESVKEYQTLNSAAREATVAAVNELEDVNIEGGAAYIAPEHSTIRIGIFVDNKLLGEEFQYRLEAAGGKAINTEDKVKIFDMLFNDLPGGDNVQEGDVRSKLMGVVGLGQEAPAKGTAPSQAVAPGPAPEAEAEQKKTESVITFDSIVQEAMTKAGFGWGRVAAFLKKEMEFLDDEVAEAQKVYLRCSASKETDSFFDGQRIIEVGSTVHPVRCPERLCLVSSILLDRGRADLKLKDLTNEDTLVLDSSEVVTY